MYKLVIKYIDSELGSERQGFFVIFAPFLLQNVNIFSAKTCIFYVKNGSNT